MGELDLVGRVYEWFVTAPFEARALLLFAMAFLILGHTVLIYFSARRRGIPFTKTLMPTSAGFEAAFDLNKAEIVVYCVIFIITVLLGSVAVAVAQLHALAAL